jgi:hypothetical protein
MTHMIQWDVHKRLYDGAQAQIQELQELLDKAHSRHMVLLERAHKAELQVEELTVALDLGSNKPPAAGPVDSASFKLRMLLRAELQMDAIRAAIRIAKDQLLESEEERLEGEDEEQVAVYDAIDQMESGS